MAQTMTQKIFARHSGRDHVVVGENVWVNVDVLMTHDVCGPGAIAVFQERFGENARVFDPEKVVIIPDHYIFTEDALARRNVETVCRFADEQNLPYCYPPGTEDYRGVCHVTLPLEGHCRPGEILLGTDSHTCTHGAFGLFSAGIGNTEAGFVMGTGKLWLKVPPTQRFIIHGTLPDYLMAKDVILAIIGKIGVDGGTYQVMEFSGEAVQKMEIDERMTLCNMAVEAGAKSGIIEPDDMTDSFVKSRTDTPYQVVCNDADAEFAAVHEFDAGSLEPVLSCPHSPQNVKSARDLAGEKIDRVYIGSCTGGKIADFRGAARILKGRSTKVETFIVPATTHVDRALDDNMLDGQSWREVFAEAGCKIGPPSCAACLGGPEDTFGRANAPLTVVSTTNRNFPGRMGHKDARIFLSSPLTAAASALTGCITDPRESS